MCLKCVNDFKLSKKCSSRDTFSFAQLYEMNMTWFEDLIVDNSVHSDLDPLEAPEWSIGVTLQVICGLDGGTGVASL